MFNPFKYQYRAKLLRFEGEEAVLKLQSGAMDQEVHLPKMLLPKEITEGDSFNFSFQPKEAAEANEEKTLKRLLEELIR